MKVSELIEALRKMPQDAEVLRPNYNDDGSTDWDDPRLEFVDDTTMARAVDAPPGVKFTRTYPRGKIIL